MKKFKTLSKTLLAPKHWASALLITVLLGLAVPTTAIAQDDAGAVAEVEVAAETAPAPVAEAPAEAAPELAVADAPEPAIVAPAPSAAQTSLDKLSSEVLNILIPVLSVN